VYDLIQKIFNNQDELHIYGDGSQVRDFIFVEDAVRAMMFVAERGQLQGEVYNVASGQETAIQELVETLCSIMDAHPRLVYTGAVRPGEPEKWAVDINQINNLGFLPRVSLWEGLRRTVTWFSSFTKG
jgi:UDP-glucose 4-epimerase